MQKSSINDVLNVFNSFVNKVDNQIKDVVVILSHGTKWINEIKVKANNDKNLHLFSDVDDFKQFINGNGAREIMIDLDIEGHDTIKMAEDLNLQSFFDVDLTFISNRDPDQSDVNDILKIGASFKRKKDILNKNFMQKKV